jgi:hypothetical protein
MMNRKYVVASLAGFVLLIVAAISPLLRADSPSAAPPSAPPPGVDPKADAWLRKMGKTLSAAQQFTFEIHDLSDQILPSGQEAQFSRTVDVAIRRPDALAAQVDGDLESKRFFYSNGKLAIVNSKANVYAIQDVPATLDKMFDFLDQKFGITVTLSDLAFPDPYQDLIERVYNGTYLGLHDVNGVKCHHLAFRAPNIDWQIWIEDSDQALPRKMVITYKDQPDVPQYIAVLDKWNLSPQFTDSTFAFTPPADAKRQDLVPLDTTNLSSGKSDAGTK